MTRSYDAANRLSSLTDWLKNSTSFAYDANDNLTSQSYPNGTKASFSYDTADELSQIQDSKGTSPLWTFGHSRDQPGQLASASDPIENLSHSYSYDPLNRLTGDSRSAGTTSWSYDAADQLKSSSDTSNTSKSLTYDLAHELTGFVAQTGTTTTSNLTLSYNANGDRTQQTDSVGSSSATYAYDQADRLTSSTYKYDGDGLRMSKTTGKTTSQFAWEVADGLPTILVDGSTSYVTGPDGLPLEQISGSKALSYYQDQLGSTRGILDSRGSTQGTYSYGPYGELTSSSGSVTNPFRYAGQYTDAESGLQYLRARYYDPATAQFLTVDPLMSLTGEAYVYAGGGPLNAVDPSGMDFLGIGGFVQRHKTAVAAVAAGVVVAGAVACVLTTVGVCAAIAVPEVMAGAAAGGAGVAATVATDAPAPAVDEAATVMEGCPEAIESGIGALDRIVETPAGPVHVYGDVTVEGNTVTIDVAAYGQQGEKVRAGVGPFLRALREYERELASKGYRALRIYAYRTKSGHDVYKTIDLTKYSP